MKIGGVDPKTLCHEVLLVLPRGEQDLVFRARGLKDMDGFNAKCPQPKPPGKLTRDGYVPMSEDPTYQTVLGEWAKKRLGFIVMRSLEPSDIEWDTVKEDDPRSWPNWEQDLRDGGLSEIECSRVLGIVMEANALDEEKLKKARETFLHGQVQASQESSGPVTGQGNTPSGERAQG
jgi:hypothetical protein